MRLLFLLFCLATFPFGVEAQFNSGHGENPCGFDGHHDYLMKTDMAYKAGFLKQKAIFDSLKYAPHVSNREQRQLFTIPVVVHVIHLGEQIGYQTNIPDQQILGAIEGLNERYANVNGAGVDIGITFCLANRDPNGCPTSGINRVDGSVIPGYKEEGITWDGNCGVNEQLIKDLSKWPTWEYYNIWVVNDICGDVAGYAYYPNGGEYDGTVIDIVSMKYDNVTLSHELGHGLNLKHTFSGGEDDCPDNNDCLDDGDEICDTPPHRTNQCGNNNPCSSEGVWNNSRYNYMSYCFPSEEVGRFTPDQHERILNALSVDPRAALLSSQGCANEVSMSFTSDGTTLCPNEERVLTAVPGGGYFAIASGTGYLNGNTLTATGGTEIVVEYIIEEGNCTSSIYQAIPVKPIPQSLLKSNEDTLCIGQTATLQGFPAGGTFSLLSGPGVLDGNLLTAEGNGSLELLYQKTILGCISRDSHIVISNALQEVDIEPVLAEVLTAVPDTGTFQWVRCDLDYEAISHATDALYEVSTSGSYAVISINGACRDTSDCIEMQITATHESHNNTDIRMYPNPVQDVLYLDGILWGKENKVAVLNIQGEPMGSKINHGQNRIEIDFSTLLPGVYLIQVDEKGFGRHVYKVVKL
ncbi:MAG TPA: zinc-dependent metalloprotease [Saprospiraceae bacterium]